MADVRKIVEPIVRGQIRDLVHQHADYLTPKGLSKSHGHTTLEESLADRIVGDLCSRGVLMRLRSALCLSSVGSDAPSGLVDKIGPEPSPDGANLSGEGPA